MLPKPSPTEEFRQAGRQLNWITFTQTKTQTIDELFAMRQGGNHITGMYQQQHSHCANHCHHSLLSEITTSTI
jgi:hypothetical protein